MSDYKIPDLPSDDELGITEEDREFLEKELGEGAPEMSEAERRALLGDSPGSSEGAEPDPKASKRARRAAKKAEKEARKAEKRARKENERRARETAQAESDTAARGAPAATTTDAPKQARSPEGRDPVQTDAGRSRSRWRGPVTLTFLLVVSVVASSRTGLPGPVAANAPDTSFSSARAMAMLTEIARDAHPPGSPEHARVRHYILERLTLLGVEPEVQATTSMTRGPTRATAARVRNVVARLPGSDPTGAILMTAHYDGREISTAAGDDGSGVATILEAVRAIQAGESLRNDVIILITDAEELPGLLGAKAFINEHPMMDDVSVVLGFEMRGSAGPSIMFETKDRNGWVIRALAALDPAPFANSMSRPVYERMRDELATDYTLFKEAGKQGLNFAAIGNAHVYHQAYDTPDDVSERTLQDHGVNALAAARHLGNADLSVVDEADVVYFSVPLLGLVLYPASLVLPISGALVLLFAGTFVVLRRAGARPSRIAIGTAVSLVAAGAAVAAAYALLGWTSRFHPEAGSLHGSLYHREGWYMIALAGTAFTAVTSTYAVARRWLSGTELALGGVALPLIAALALGFSAPFGAMNLQWPTAAALVSASLAGLLGARSDGVVGWLTALLLATPVLVLLVPVTELLWIAMSIEVGAVLTLLTVILLQLCPPVLEALRHPNGWWAPLTGLVTTGAALGVGILTSGPAPERPAPSTLVYAYEHGTGAAVWATDAAADSLDTNARAWAVARAGGTFDGIRDLSAFGYLSGQTPTASAPVISATPPEVVVARDSIDGTARRVTLEVRSRIGAELIAFARGGRHDVVLLSIDGVPLGASQQLGWLDFWGGTDSAVALELEMPADAPIDLHVIEHLLRPDELLGEGSFERPPGLAPDITRMSDRAMFRYSVGAFADPRYALVLPGAAQDTLTAPPGEEPPDTAAAPGSPPDTATAPPDTGSTAITDTLSAGADSGAIRPSGGSGPRVDTAVAQPDTGSVRPDTLAVPPR